MKTKKLVVTSYSTDPRHPGLEILYDSLAEWGWPRLRLWSGEHRYLGHNFKIAVMAASLPLLRHDGVTHALTVDSWDTFIAGNFDGVLDFCDDGAMVSAERACYPHPDKASLYPPETAKSDWKYVNGGGLLYDLNYFEYVLLPTFKDHDNDQIWLTDQIIGKLPGLKIDSRNELFQCVGHCDMARDFEKLGDGRFRNRQTGTVPKVWHGNGRTNLDYFLPHWKPWWEDYRE